MSSGPVAEAVAAYRLAVGGPEEGLVYERVVATVRTELARAALKMGASTFDADEVAQIKALSLASWAVSGEVANGSEDAYVAVGARNCLRDLRRKIGRRKEEPATEGEAVLRGARSSEPDPEQALLGTEAQQALEEALAAMAPVRRDTLVRVDVDGEPIESLAREELERRLREGKARCDDAEARDREYARARAAIDQRLKNARKELRQAVLARLDRLGERGI